MNTSLQRIAAAFLIAASTTGFAATLTDGLLYYFPMNQSLASEALASGTLSIGFRAIPSQAKPGPERRSTASISAVPVPPVT